MWDRTNLPPDLLPIDEPLVPDDQEPDRVAVAVARAAAFGRLLARRDGLVAPDALNLRERIRGFLTVRESWLSERYDPKCWYRAGIVVDEVIGYDLAVCVRCGRVIALVDDEEPSIEQW